MSLEINVIIFILAIFCRVTELHFSCVGSDSDDGIMESDSCNNFARYGFKKFVKNIEFEELMVNFIAYDMAVFCSQE